MQTKDQTGFVGGDWNANSKEYSKVSLEDLLCSHHPELYSIAKIDWKIFGTLTWRTDARRLPTAQEAREDDFRKLLLLAAKDLKISFRQLSRYHYHVMEYGAAGECHFHFLVAKAGLEKINDSQMAASLERIWKNELRLGLPDGSLSGRLGAGGAVVKAFDEARALSGLSYVTKREYRANGEQRDRQDTMSKDLPRLLEPC